MAIQRGGVIEVEPRGVMRYRTRVFLSWLLPVAILLSLSFWIIEGMVQSAVHDGLREGLRQNHAALSSVQARADLRNSRFLKIAGENTALKASLQLLLVEGSNPAAQATLEDELQELCDRMGFDLFVVTAPDRTPLAGVIRAGLRLVPVPHAQLPALNKGLFLVRSELYQTASVPVELNGEQLGTLVVGEVFEFSGFSTPAVLSGAGHVLRSSVPGVTNTELERALKPCGTTVECDISLNGVTHLSLPMRNTLFGNDFSLRSVQNVDAAIQPVRRVLRLLFVSVFVGATLIAILCGAFSSRAIVRPISALVEHLRHTESSGLVPVTLSRSGIREIDELTRTFNQAAIAARDAREGLQDAYTQFVATLAAALDARDRYTAGHSERVSALACRIAHAMGLTPAEINRIRMGALLHDIGKIGISDVLLQKPAALTDQEMAVIRQHPSIGRHILHQVHGFSEWLDAVELHHENWDGTGYPHRLKGNTIPLDARIVHVADAYDAMTTDRPYRKAMAHECAIKVLQTRAGFDFDPRIVTAISLLDPTSNLGQPPEMAIATQLLS